MIVLVSEAFGKWLGHEGGALINGMCALTKRNYRAPEPFTPGEDIVVLWYFVIVARMDLDTFIALFQLQFSCVYIFLLIFCPFSSMVSQVPGTMPSKQ